MEKSLKRQIVDAAEAVKKKVRKMRDFESENKQALESVFRPVTESLNCLANTNKQTDLLRSKEVEETKVPLSNDILQKGRSSNETEGGGDSGAEENEGDTDSDESYQSLGENNQERDTSSWSISSEALTDIPFGVRAERGQLMLGSAFITISDDYITVAGRKYRTTPGLKQLLLKKDVDLSTVTESDKQYYKMMLIATNAHRRDFDSNKPIKSNKGQKYLQIIKPLFKLPSTIQSSQSKGKGLPLTKMWKKNADFIYWDDPNELVDRLKLLIASRDAGNTGLDNEIISIMEELRESKLIK